MQHSLTADSGLSLTQQKIWNLKRINMKKQLSDQLIDLYNSEFVDVDFLNEVSSVGRKGCIIELGSGNQKLPKHSDCIAFLISSILSKKDKIVACLANTGDPGVNERLKISDVASGSSTRRDIGRGKVSVFGERDEENRLTTFLSDPTSMKNFQHVIISLGSDVNNISKLNCVETSNFFILVGQKGLFRLDEVKRFLSTSKATKEKCLGLVLFAS